MFKVAAAKALGALGAVGFGLYTAPVSAVTGLAVYATYFFRCVRLHFGQPVFMSQVRLGHGEAPGS